MNLFAYRNTMRNAVPVFDPESPDEQLRQRMARQREAERKHRGWIQAIDRAKSERTANPAQKLQRAIDNQFRVMPPWVREIVSGIVARHGAEIGDVLFRRTRGAAALARNEICYTLKAAISPVTGDHPSLEMIGRWMNREYTSVLHCIAIHQNDNDLPIITTRSAEAKRRYSRDWHVRHGRGGK
jgi:hypothetical protein